MVAEFSTQSRASASSKLALLVHQNWSRHTGDSASRTREFLAVVNAVANEEQAIKFRNARYLAWVKGKDLQQAGYPSWTAFKEEHSPWSPEHTDTLVALAQSELDLIEEAVSKNEIQLTDASRALKRLGKKATPEAQRQWIREKLLQDIPERERPFMDMLTGEDMRRVLRARKLATILRGGRAPAPVLDLYILDCYAQKLTCDQITERARATPPIPERLGQELPERKSDPAEGLLGPWVEPTSVQDAVAKIRATTLLLDQRRVLLAMAYFLIRIYYLWTDLPECSSLGDLCLLHLDISQRTLQRFAKQGMHYFQWPGLKELVFDGRLTPDRAVFAADRAAGGEKSLQSWIELVRRLGRVELHRAQERDGDMKKEYAPALEMARAVESILRGAETSNTAPEIRDVESALRNEHAHTEAPEIRKGESDVGGEPTSNAAPGIQEVESAVRGGDTNNAAPEIREAESALRGEATGIAAPEIREGGSAGEGLHAVAPEIRDTASRIADHLRAVGAMGPIQIALRDDRKTQRSREPEFIFAPRNLLAAANYLLDTVVLPPVYGTRRMVEHDGYTCQNPRCRRPTLRVHPHHIHQQQHGGTDEPANIVSGCPACHLRGIHSNQMSVVRIDDWLVWTWPDGGVVIMDSQVSALVYEKRVRPASPEPPRAPPPLPPTPP